MRLFFAATFLFPLLFGLVLVPLFCELRQGFLLSVHGFADTGTVRGIITTSKKMTTEPNTGTDGSSSLSSSTNLIVPLGSVNALDDCNDNNDSNGISSEEYEYDYDSNPSVFGKILRGELANSRIVGESNRLLVFEDIKPRAPLHALVIPKQQIPSLFDLDDCAITTTASATITSSSITSPFASLSLLEEMNASGHDLVRTRYPEAYERGDYILCFHLPPFVSVDHLHLHVLAPASSMHWIYRNVKYHVEKSSDSNNSDEFEKRVNANAFSGRWSIGMEDVLARVRAGSTPTPYRKDDDWSTTLRATFSSIGAILSSSVFG